MKAYEVVDVDIHIFLTLALVGGELSSSRLGRLTLGETAVRYPLDRRLSGPQYRSGRRGEEKNLDRAGIRTPTRLLSRA
jgi:hypothetical protein